MRYIKILQDKDLIEFRGAPKTGGYFTKMELQYFINYLNQITFY